MPTKPTLMMVCEESLTYMRTLDDGSVDAIITDPPYESNAHANQVKVVKHPNGSLAKVTKGSLPFAPLTPELRVALALEFVRLSKGWIIVFCQHEAIGDWKRAIEYAHGVYKRVAFWIKPNAQPQMSGDRPGNGAESIVCAYSNPGRSVWNGGGKLGLYHALPDSNRVHPTQKPVDLMDQLVKDFTSLGDLILDPFAGSGTTGVSAKRHARQFIGIELDPLMCDTAHQRLKVTEPIIDGSSFGFTKPKQITLFEGGRFKEGTTSNITSQENS